MQAEILMIGTELLIGQIVDTNATFLAETMAENGINLFQKTTVGDNPGRIQKALSDALDRSDVVLTSGGLGPTEDDITRECIADLLGRPLEFQEEVLRQLEERFAHLGRTLAKNNKKQAYAPQGATIIDNPNGSAPGLIVEDGRGTIICMPGVPKELKAMMRDSVAPYLRRRFALNGVLHSRVLKICGMGESRIDSAMGELIRTQENPTVGILANPNAVRIRISARAQNVDKANKMIDEIDAQVRKRLPGLIMGVDDDTIESVVDALLRERGWTVSVVETDTGGMIGQRLTAAGAVSFTGGLTLRASTLEDAVKHAREHFDSDCILVLVRDENAGQTTGRFLSPDGECDWTVTYPALSEYQQVRASVLSLEYVRRHLTGR